MARKLPPLNALRAFEAAGRHLSFSKAAEELHVTPAAISHQIKGLEEWLGVRLFRRLNRQILLTDAGQRYLPGLREGFDSLAVATDRVVAHQSSGALTLSAMSSFSAKWLVPRLPRFRERHPDIDIRLSTNDSLVDFSREDFEVAIRFGRGNWPGVEAIWLLSEDIFPVCSPTLLAGDKPLHRPEDLAFHTLLHDDFYIDWQMWLQAAGLEGINPDQGPAFSDSSFVLQAAIDGQGVALARSVLAQADLAAGRLVRPFDVSLPAGYAYYLVYPSAYADRPKILAFREWLLDEAKPESNPSESGQP